MAKRKKTALQEFKESPAPRDGMIKTTLRVPDSLWSEILILAIVQHTSAQAIVTTALRSYIEDADKERNTKEPRKGGR
jgi:hypothetical protein